VSAPGVIAQIKNVARKGIQKGALAAANLLSYTSIDFAGRILSDAVALKEKSEQPSIFAHQVRPALTQTAPAQATLPNPTIVKIAGHDTLKPEELEKLAEAAFEVVGDGLSSVLKLVYQLAPTKLARQTAKQAILNQRQLETA